MMAFLAGGLALAAVAFGGALIGDPFAKPNATWTTTHHKAAP